MASIKYTDHKTEDIMQYWFIYNDSCGYIKGILTHSPSDAHLSDRDQHMYRWMIFA